MQPRPVGLLQSKPELLDVDELELLEVADVDELLELLVAVLELVPPPTVPLDIHDSVPSGPNKNSP